MLPIRRTGRLALVVALLAGSPWAMSHPEEPQNPPPAAPPPTDDPIPDLDDLLGIPKEDGDAEGDAALAPPDAARTELDRELADERIDDKFREAIVLMGDTALRLENARDAGVQTQRLQEEVLKRLDALIAAAKRQQSPSSSPQQQQQQQQEQQQARQSQQAGQTSSPSDAQDEFGQRPGGQTEPLREMLDAASAAWGALPPRVRDALLQGSDEKFSSLYETLTEEYYRRLAEQRPEE